MKKKFYLSNDDCWLGGVCGGIAEYFNIDPMLVRIIFLAGFLYPTIPMGLIYFITWILAPSAEK